MLFNSSEEILHLARGTPLGWLGCDEVWTAQQLVQEAIRSRPEMVSQLQHEWESAEEDQSLMVATLQAVVEGASDEDVKHLVARVSRESKEGEEAKQDGPRFELPEEHQYKGCTGEQMVEHVQKYRMRECEQWYEDNAAKLIFGEQLSESDKKRYVALLFALKDIFAENPKAPPLVKGVQHALYFKDQDPVPLSRKLPKLSPQQKEVFSKETMAMLINGIIEFSTSEWATVPVFAPKKDAEGGWTGIRTAIDYRYLNSLCISDSLSVPNMLDTLENLSQAAILSTFDGASGFWACDLRESDRKYAVFHAFMKGSWHVVQPKRMMFGFKNATSTYQRMMNVVYGPSVKQETVVRPDGGVVTGEISGDGLVGDIVEAFVDDSVAKSKDEKDHINDLAKVLVRLLANNITLKMEKGLWATKRLPLLGHVVRCKQGIEADPSKVEAMAAMKPPQLVSDVRTFLGASGFLHKYVPEYSTYAAVLRELDDKTKTGCAEVVWNDRSLAAFNAIKQSLVSAPLLYFPDFSKPWIITCDSSNGQLGACLSQLDDEGVERPIAYASSSLTAAQKKWGISCKEGLGVVWATRKFRSYIKHGSVIVVTDHSALLSLRKQKKEFQNDRLARWAAELDQYDMLIAHRPGRHLFMPDMLSRALTDLQPEEIQDVIEKSWGRTAHLIMDYPHWTQQMFKVGAQQARLRKQIAGAVVAEQRGMPAMSVYEAVAAIQQNKYEAEQVSSKEPEDLLVYDMYEMACAWVEEAADGDAAEMAYELHEETCELQDGSQALTIDRVKRAQLEDPFCVSMVRYLQSGGESMPYRAKEAAKVVSEERSGLWCARWCVNSPEHFKACYMEAGSSTVRA